MPTISKLATSDLDLFLQFVTWNAEGNTSLPPKEELSDWFSNPNHHVWIAQEENMVIAGLTAYTLPSYQQFGNELFIYEVGVDDAYKRQGFGKALMQACLAFAKDNQYLSVYVATEHDNLPARKLFASTGGVEESISWWVWQ